MRNPVRLAINISIGIAFDQRLRRKAMFVLTLAALILLFVGTTILWPTFPDHPLFFAIYWLICAWLTVCVILLSIYDLLTVGRQHRRDVRQNRHNLDPD